MSPKPDVTEDRKNQIVEAATKVFARLGINNARMDDIVEESGLSKGTLYWYFESKDEIITNIIGKLFEPEFRDMDAIAKEDISAVDKLLKITDRLVADIDTIMKYMPLAYEFIALAYRKKYVKGIVKSYFNQYIEKIIKIIDEGIENKEIYTPDSRQTAVHLGAIFEGTLLLWLYDRDNVKISEDIRTGMMLIIDKIKI